MLEKSFLISLSSYMVAFFFLILVLVFLKIFLIFFPAVWLYVIHPVLVLIVFQQAASTICTLMFVNKFGIFLAIIFQVSSILSGSLIIFVLNYLILSHKSLRICWFSMLFPLYSLDGMVCLFLSLLKLITLSSVSPQSAINPI